MSDERMTMTQQKINFEDFSSQRVEYTPQSHIKPFFIISISICYVSIVMLLFGDGSLWYLFAAIMMNVAVSLLQNNESSQLGNQIMSKVAAVKNEFISMVGYFINMVAAVRNEFISMDQTRSTYSSIRKISLRNIMLIWVSVVFTFGIAVKLWIKDIPTSFMCLNITVSLINFPMVANLLLPPMRAQHSEVLIWLTTFLVILNEKPSLKDSPSYLLMHYHYGVNLLVFAITTFLVVIPGLYRLYNQYNTTNEDTPNNGRSFVVQQGNISPNKFSNLENMYGVENFRRCFGLLVYLFPTDYEYEKKDIIQLWMADGFTRFFFETNKLLEDAANVYFDAFSAASIFQSSHSNGNSQPRYKLNRSILHDLHKPPIYEYCRIESGKQVSLSENTLYTSFICDSSDPVTFKALYQSKKLSTLLLVHAQRYSSINRIPYDLFLELPLLRALDLSGTNITELPSSVGNLKQLRLLNLSKTLVRRLPDSLCSLYLMQTMILRDCSKLVGLPKEMRKLVNLRHLDLDIASLLISMPPGVGALTELQTLCAFIVGKDDGSRITELKHMEDLRGSLGIMMLENILNSEEAKEAALGKKIYLERFELQWTELQEGADGVLEHLQPHQNLKELQIVGYGGAQFPGWIGNPYFSKLVTVTLHNCSKCEVLPPLGKLPSLERLQISEMHRVKTIDARFCGREMVTPHLDLVLETVHRRANPCHGFLRLNNLRISRMPTLEKWLGMGEGDFSLLCKLSLSRLAKLTALPKLSFLKALQELEISLCPVLHFLPKKSLPTSLQSLLIISCPLLKEQCRKEGQEWGKIAHIPSIWIDNQQIL